MSQMENVAVPAVGNLSKEELLKGLVKNDQRHKYKICISCICKAMSFSIWCDGDITGFYRTFYTVIIVLAFTT